MWKWPIPGLKNQPAPSACQLEAGGSSGRWDLADWHRDAGLCTAAARRDGVGVSHGFWWEFPVLTWHGDAWRIPRALEWENLGRSWNWMKEPEGNGHKFMGIHGSYGWTCWDDWPRRWCGFVQRMRISHIKSLLNWPRSPTNMGQTESINHLIELIIHTHIYIYIL